MPIKKLADLERVAPAFLPHRSEAVRAVDWALLRDRFGAGFPADYVEYCSHYGILTIDDFLSIIMPSPGHEERFVGAIDDELDMMRDFAEDDMTEGYTIYPEPNGLFLWAASNEGDMFFWRMSGPDPDTWPVVVHTRNDDWWEHEGGMLSLLVGFIDGSVEHRGLPPRPGPDPTVE